MITDLKEVAVATIELDLESDVRAITNARDVKLADIDGNARRSLSRRLEERDSKRQLNSS